MPTTRSRQRAQGTTSGSLWLLYVLDAGLLVASGLIHLHLWDIAYRHVKTLDQLFLAQTALCILAAIVLLAARRVIVVAGCALLMAGTIVGFLLARTVGIFGFKLPYITGEAYAVLVIEAVAVLLLIITGALMQGGRRAGRHG